MKLSLLSSALFALVSFVSKLEATDGFRLETNIYVFKSSDFSSITIPGADETSERRGTIFTEGVAHFGEETLSLEGAQFIWSSGEKPPERFSLIGMPVATLVPGKQLTLLSSLPVQYVEKRKDGTLQVHEISPDSPEAPHFRLSFTMLPESVASENLRLTCLLDIATISSRAKVAGVALDIGKPVLAKFNEKVDFTLRAAEWSAFSLQSPNGSDYNLLLLLKAVPLSAADVTAAAKEQKDTRTMTAEEIAQFATFYYQHPQPELIGRMLESLGPSKFFSPRRSSAEGLRRAFKVIGFLREIFAANPSRVAEWRQVIDRSGQSADVRFWLGMAYGARPPNPLVNRSEDSELLDRFVFASSDMLWGAFFASGNAAYLRQLADRLDGLSAYVYDSQVTEGADAMVSLAYNAPHHPLVRQTLEERRQKASRATRGIIDDILKKDLSAVRQKAVYLQREFFTSRDSFYSRMDDGVNMGGIPGPTLSPMLQHAGDNAAQQNQNSSSSHTP